MKTAQNKVYRKEFEPSFELWWCYAGMVLFGSLVPVTTGGFELQSFCIRSSYLTH